MQRYLGGESGQSAIAILGTLVAVVVALAAAFGVYAFVTRDGGESRPAHPLPPLHEFTAQQQQQLHDIRDATAAIRETSTNATTHEGTLTRDEYRSWVGESYGDLTAREEERLRALNIAFRLLHMIGPGDDLLAGAKVQESEDVIGFYHPKQNELVLIGDGSNLTPSDDFTLSHEYVHSFQEGMPNASRAESLADQERDGDPTEYETTISCVEEGDATLTSALWARKTIGEDWAEKRKDSSPANPESAPPPTPVPPALERYFNFDYDQCPSFVAAIYRHGGWSDVNGLYARPPTTTEQILHPKKYLDAEPPSGMKPVDIRKRLGKGWAKQTLDMFGEFDVYNYLLSALGDEQLATQAAAGWGSAWAGVYSRDAGGDSPNGDVLVHIAIEWDTRRDAREFASAYGALIDRVASRQGGGDAATCWSLPGEFGYFNWDAKKHRSDIVISNNEAVVKAATSDALSLPSRPCPTWAGPGQQGDGTGVVANPPSCELAQPGREIDLVGVADFPSPLLARLQASLRAEYGLTVNVLPVVNVGSGAIDQSRGQLRGEGFVNTINRQAARGRRDEVVIGITANDMMLGTNPDSTFAFFAGDPSLHAGVISIAHMDPEKIGPAPDAELLFTRVEKIVAMTVGMLYLNRPLVPDPRSLMYGDARSVADIDAMGDDLCAA